MRQQISLTATPSCNRREPLPSVWDELQIQVNNQQESLQKVFRHKVVEDLNVFLLKKQFGVGVFRENRIRLKINSYFSLPWFSCINFQFINNVMTFLHKCNYFYKIFFKDFVQKIVLLKMVVIRIQQKEHIIVRFLLGQYLIMIWIIKVESDMRLNSKF